ncbi:MAG TPA: hypothetical protein VEA69_08505 [Tepidisphaeraceae bacterium]|nr:hypothetical protein [Tepidisphaeraceae bacterium]
MKDYDGADDTPHADSGQAARRGGTATAVLVVAALLAVGVIVALAMKWVGPK